MKPKVLILKAAGMNCDMETAFAFQGAGAETEFVHINELVSKEKRLSDFQILAFSGGFTYGDDIAAGKILANELKYKMFDELKGFVEKGNLIIGICNGFQVLIRSGLLPGNPELSQEATLSGNDCGRFIDRWVYLKRPNETKDLNKCIWTRGIKHMLYLPIAHGEGKFIPKSEDVLRRLKEKSQIVLQYCDENGSADECCANPNGSIDGIAGICDETGRIFGLMPHPERHLIGLQHPRWTRVGLKEHGDGFKIFLNAVDFVKQS